MSHQRTNIWQKSVETAKKPIQLPVPRSQMALLEKLYLQTGSLIPWLLPKGGGRGKQEVFQCDGVNQLSPAHYGIFTLFLYHILNIARVNESTGRLQQSEAGKKVCHPLKKQYVLKCTSVSCITQSVFPNEICRYILSLTSKNKVFVLQFYFWPEIPNVIYKDYTRKHLCTFQYDYILLCIFNMQLFHIYKYQVTILLKYYKNLQSNKFVVVSPIIFLIKYSIKDNFWRSC